MDILLDLLWFARHELLAAALAVVLWRSGLVCPDEDDDRPDEAEEGPLVIRGLEGGGWCLTRAEQGPGR